MKNNSQFISKCKLFFKKNGYYVLLGTCIIAIGVMVAIAVNTSDTTYVVPESTVSPTIAPTVEPTTEPTITEDADADADADVDADVETSTDVETSADPIELLVPVVGATVGLDYTMDGFVFSQTLNQWQTHSGIDYVTDVASDVMACYDGVVTSVITNDILNGGVVVISHEGGLESTYMSLGSDITVSVGDTVSKGDVIGQTSQSAYAEYAEGIHVHFELTQDGEYVDPNDYFTK
ncbi:MAG: M23 family metallopeptidase [Bacillota bacterium]